MTKIRYSIPSPCHEDWNQMTPKDQGRFCASCEKVVVDFRTMSVEEVQTYLSENQKVCGTFNKSQLNEISLRIPIEVIEKNMHNPLRLFFLAFLMTMGSTLLSCSNQEQTIGKIYIESPKKEETLIEIPLQDTITVKHEKDSLKKAKDLKALDLNLDGSLTGIICTIPTDVIRKNDEPDTSVNEKLNEVDTLDFTESLEE